MSSFILPGDSKVKVNDFSKPRKIRFTGDGVSVTEDASNDRFNIAITGGGGGAGSVNSASNVGIGEGEIFKQLAIDDLEFKTIKAGANITVTNNVNDVTISAAGTVGEANTVTNVGGGAEVAKPKVGVDIPVRTLLAGSGGKITVTQNTNDITLQVTDASDSQKGAVELSLADGSESSGGKAVQDSDPRIKFGVYKYSIYKDGSTYYCRNNITGLIEASNSSPNTILQFPLTNGGRAYIHDADYVLTGTPTVFFQFPVEPLHCEFIMGPNVNIIVPEGFSGTVFRMSNNASQHCTKNILEGGTIKEAGTILRNWDGVLLEGIGTGNKGVYKNRVENVSIYYPYIGIRLNNDSTSTTGFVNDNLFSFNSIYGAKLAYVDFDMEASYVVATNGIHRNRFEYCLLQSAFDGNDASIGFKNVRHRENSFESCYVVDFHNNQVAGITIHADATDTEIIAGTTDDYIFTDNSTNSTTKILSGKKGFQIGLLTPGLFGTGIEIVPATSTTNTTSWYNPAKTERFYIQKNATQYQFDFVKQTSSGSLRPALFRMLDVPGATTTESFRIETDAGLRVYTDKLRLLDSNQSHYYNFIVSDISANRNITIPPLSANDIIAFLGVANTFTAINTFSNSSIHPVVTYRNTSTADNEVGGISFNGDSSTTSNVQYAGIVASIISNTNGSEQGQLKFQTKTSGTLATRMALNNSGKLFLGTNLRVGLVETGLTGQREFTFPNASSLLFGNGVDNDIGDHFLDFGDMSVPANPATGVIRLFNDSATGELSVRKSGGTTVSLESGGGGGGSGALKSGTVQRSGDGSTTVFTITHGFGSTPEGVIVIPKTAAAFGAFDTTVNGTVITITYQTAPITGTNNLEYWWLVSDDAISGGGGGSVLSLDELTDVINTSPTANQTLVYQTGSASYENKKLKTRVWMVTQVSSTSLGTRFIGWGASQGSTQTEADAETTLNSAMTLKRVYVKISTNTADQNTTFSIRRNQANVTGTSHTVAAGVTTPFDSGELTQAFVGGDEIAVMFDKTTSTTGNTVARVITEYEVEAFA